MVPGGKSELGYSGKRADRAFHPHAAQDRPSTVVAGSHCDAPLAGSAKSADRDSDGGRQELLRGLNLYEVGRAGRTRSAPPGCGMLAVAQPIYRRTDPKRGCCQVSDSQRSGNSLVLNPVQRAADAASALSTIWLSAEDARFHAALQIGGIIHRHLGKQATLRIRRRLHESTSHAFRKKQLRVLLPQRSQFACQPVRDPLLPGAPGFLRRSADCRDSPRYDRLRAARSRMTRIPQDIPGRASMGRVITQCTLISRPSIFFRMRS